MAIGSGITSPLFPAGALLARVSKVLATHLAQIRKAHAARVPPHPGDNISNPCHPLIVSMKRLTAAMGPFMPGGFSGALTGSTQLQ